MDIVGKGKRTVVIATFVGFVIVGLLFFYQNWLVLLYHGGVVSVSLPQWRMNECIIVDAVDPYTLGFQYEYPGFALDLRHWELRTEGGYAVGEQQLGSMDDKGNAILLPIQLPDLPHCRIEQRSTCVQS